MRQEKQVWSVVAVEVAQGTPRTIYLWEEILSDRAGIVGEIDAKLIGDILEPRRGGGRYHRVRRVEGMASHCDHTGRNTPHSHHGQANDNSSGASHSGSPCIWDSFNCIIPSVTDVYYSVFCISRECGRNSFRIRLWVSGL